jgi:hypothetical protein
VLGKTISVGLLKFNLYTLAGKISVMFGKSSFALRGGVIVTPCQLGGSGIFSSVSGFHHQ